MSAGILSRILVRERSPPSRADHASSCDLPRVLLPILQPLSPTSTAYPRRLASPRLVLVLPLYRRISFLFPLLHTTSPSTYLAFPPPRNRRPTYELGRTLGSLLRRQTLFLFITTNQSSISLFRTPRLYTTSPRRLSRPHVAFVAYVTISTIFPSLTTAEDDDSTGQDGLQF